MIPRRNKLSAGRFPRSGIRSVRTPFCTLKAASNDVGRARVALIISAAALPRSVDRHFWKRRFYDTLIKHTPPGYDILLIASSGIANVRPRTLDLELEAACKKLFSHPSLIPNL